MLTTLSVSHPSPIDALSEVPGWWPERQCGQRRGSPAPSRERSTGDHEPRGWSGPTLYGTKVWVVTIM